MDECSSCHARGVPLVFARTGSVWFPGKPVRVCGSCVLADADVGKGRAIRQLYLLAKIWAGVWLPLALMEYATSFTVRGTSYYVRLALAIFGPMAAVYPLSRKYPVAPRRRSDGTSARSTQESCGPCTTVADHRRNLKLLESAITNMGIWEWWKGGEGKYLLQFVNVLLYLPSREGALPPSYRIALQFEGTSCLALLRYECQERDEPENWFDLLSRRELEGYDLSESDLTLTDANVARLMYLKSTGCSFVVGEEATVRALGDSASFIAFRAGEVGIILVAREMKILCWAGETNSSGTHMAREVDPREIPALKSRWYDYHREYWAKRDSEQALPKDWICEVNVPIGAPSTAPTPS